MSGRDACRPPPAPSWPSSWSPAVGSSIPELTPADAPGLQLVVYTAADGTRTAAKLARMTA